jgi:hypothetical protein
MPATNQTITLWRGDDLVITIPVRDKSEAFVNLSGAGARWWMGKTANAKGSNIFLQKSVGSGIEITNPGSGQEWDLVITITKADTENLRVGTFYHEAEITIGGRDATVCTGPFILNQTLITGV